MAIVQVLACLPYRMFQRGDLLLHVPRLFAPPLQALGVLLLQLRHPRLGRVAFGTQPLGLGTRIGIGLAHYLPRRLHRL